MPAPRLLILYLALLATIPSGIADVVTTTKDGIIIAAEASVGANGWTHITCSLTNQSPYTLASVHTGSAGPCFQFSLLDAKGNRVPQDKHWSINHRQDDVNAPANPRVSYNRVILTPSEKEEFNFDLEDAYGKRAVEGRTLEVKWKNLYGGSDELIDVGQKTYPDGRVVPAHEEANHFPGLWTVSVSVPLPKRGGDEKPAPDSDLPSANPPPEKTSQEIPINKAAPLATSTPKNPPPSPNPWWWALLAIPALFLAWLGLRSRKQT